MDILKERYDVMPHGIVTKKDGKIYAAFKMVVCIDDFMQAKYLTVNNANWIDLAQRVNKIEWTFKIEGSGTNSQTLTLKKKTAVSLLSLADGFNWRYACPRFFQHCSHAR